MKLVVGLGNPGEKYSKTRHNVGFMVLEKLKNELSKSEASNINDVSDLDFKKERKFHAEIFRMGDLLLVKPQTFMNESGKSVSLLASFYKIPAKDIYIVHDDLDLRLGEFKIQKGVGPKLHYGIRSIEEMFGSKDFWRVRVGIENRSLTSGQKIKGEDFVLQPFSDGEFRSLNETLDKVVLELMNIMISKV